MKPKRVPYLDSATGLWRIDDVPMVSTGIEYPASTGAITFTEEDLADAVRATSDVAIASPRVKLGHRSDYNEPLIKDAEPAFGRWDNLRLGDSGQTVYGDMVGLPEWLAKVVNVAYPNRSIEATHDVETVTGKRYKTIIYDCSLLGVKWPGCSVLEDLPLWFGSETPDGAEIEAVGGGMRFFKDRQGKQHAALDVSLIRRKFYNEGPGSQHEDWWVRGERFDSEDGYTLIVDMGDGELARVPVVVDGLEPMFGDPVVVTAEYPDKVAASAAVLAGMAMSDSDMVVYASRADTDVRSREKGAQMNEATRQKLAKKLNLSADATAEEINDKLAATVLAEAGTEEGSETPAPETETPTTTPETGEPSEEGEPGEPATEGEGGNGEPATTEASKVTLDRETYDMLKKGAEAGLRLESESRSEKIKLVLDSSIGKGKIPPARRQHYESLLKADFKGTTALLDSLEEGAIPVGARGSSGGDNEGNPAGDDGGGFPDSWFPEIQTIRANASKNRVIFQGKEG